MYIPSQKMSDKKSTPSHPASFTDSKSRKTPQEVVQANLTAGADSVAMWVQKENGDLCPLVSENGRLKTTTSISSGTVRIEDGTVLDEAQLIRLGGRITAEVRSSADRTVSAVEALSKSIDSLVEQLVTLMAR